MPYVGQDWEVVDPSVVVPRTYDFSNRIPVGDNIVSASWTLEVAPSPPSYIGTDPNPSAKLSTPSFTNTTATVWLGPGQVAGTRYRLIANITSRMGITDDLWAYQLVNPQP